MEYYVLDLIFIVNIVHVFKSYWELPPFTHFADRAINSLATGNITGLGY